VRFLQRFKENNSIERISPWKVSIICQLSVVRCPLSVAKFFGSPAHQASAVTASQQPPNAWC
jgi:hypothetical protein